MTPEEREEKKKELAKARIKALEEGLRSVEHLDWIVEDGETDQEAYRGAARDRMHEIMRDAERTTRVKQGDLDKEFEDDGSWEFER